MACIIISEEALTWGQAEQIGTWELSGTAQEGGPSTVSLGRCCLEVAGGSPAESHSLLSLCHTRHSQHPMTGGSRQFLHSSSQPQTGQGGAAVPGEEGS